MSYGGDPLVGKVLNDRFEILERIGEGGSGVVYKAKQLSVDRVIAIKVLGAHVSTDPSWVKRFHNEARAASKLDHPNTVRLIDFGQTPEGLLFIAMEFLHGRSLRQEIERAGRLSPDRVLRIVEQICASLSEAHNQGIIHRDIKPDNVYVLEAKGGEDFVKVLDFSVAKLDAPDAHVTRAGMVFGTPAYMSPEQGRGIPLDRRSDIYAVGIVMYEMLSGRLPFDAKIPTEIVMMHLREQPPALVGYPQVVVDIIMKALQKDPRQRQQTTEVLEAECREAMSQLYPSQRVSIMSAGVGSRVKTPPPMTPIDEPYEPRVSRQAPSKRTMALDVGGADVQRAPSSKHIAHVASPDQRTMAMESAQSQAVGGTMMLPSSGGVVAFAEGEALAARQSALAGRQQRTPVGFWLAWVVLGVGVGLIMHFAVMR